MSIKLSDNIRVRQQKPLEDKYFNELVPYTSISQVNNLLPQAVRHIGLTVNINKEEYWYKDGIADSNLVLKITNNDINDLKNQEQDDRLENLEGENANQNDLINDLFSELQSEKTRNDIQDEVLNNLEGIYYTWSSTSRTLTLFNREGTQLSQVSLVSLDNEGTDLRYNASTLSLELYNGDNVLLDSIPVSSFVVSVGTQLQLSSNELQLKDSQGNILSTVTFEVNNINGLQTALNSKQARLQDVTGNIGVGKTDASATEKLDVNGNVKANGFKTPNGALNKALTSDGNTFDLDKKADLVDGKVPKAQSQPSTMVMNRSTYVITFTDATGAVQTIDLPLESLFQNANYDSSTKSLIVTLQDGTTRTIPLTDLVDLPEIVLATTNPAVTPTSGQKVYFNTSLGKVWFNANGVWVFGGNLISDSEKANIAAAYNHSQATGNPHNTKVDELTDVGSETPSIEDTDIILKKEAVGGLWRKITFANFKSWFTTALAKKINIGLDTVFNFKNISAMTLNEFRSITPNIETIYFTEEQNATGWQQVRYNSNYSIGYQALIETAITINAEDFLELDSDSSFNLINVENTKINGIFENDFVIITFSAKVETPSTPNQWFKIIMRINGVQAAVSPVFYLLEPAGMPERISHSFALNVPAEMVTHGATLHIKPSAMLIFNSLSITVARVHKSALTNL